MTTDLDDAAATFGEVRPRLFGIAYRMLGSVHEAEDLIQDVWLKWQAYDRSTVKEPAAFLATMTTRLAINATQSARVRRETYIGPWLPEPVDTSADPALGAERGEALELAVLLLLEKLSPTQRAAYVLREAFGYPYDEIAEIVQLSEANVRQLVSRSRKRLADERREPVDGAEQRRLLNAFLAAAQQGDLASLEQLLAADVASYSDGGGVARASRIPVLGRTQVSKYVASFASRFWVGTTLTWVETNGRSAVLIARDGVAFALVTVSASAEGIDQIQWAMNPAKLTAVTPPGAALS
ncbi:RNA polymerase sigma-70 factor (ECF subfamily) [Kribbella orskensis]|uniref:RNA polymerase sigma-70 factor (ECF subfamily) n=1 Tax=Kribbella orskensis TaxID=2512216 RepID=A0ABY2BJ13_9ACTN|nr:MULTISPECIES: RNA polymerase sigma-70 factor [Kribbella]TCN38869.1 RNA polymerase sigma-70 factor (ECF subfamily) [Kribbella sp. VKM Ac-2500]TCO21050.1 RNA polymerase sigma-70 factor (ECF subfamily) [Kribbella orskensis]